MPALTSQLGAAGSGQPVLSVHGGRQAPLDGSQTGRLAGQAVTGQAPWQRPELGSQTGAFDGQSAAVVQGGRQTPSLFWQLGTAGRVQSALAPQAA